METKRSRLTSLKVAPLELKGPEVYSHVRVLKWGASCIQRESSGGFDRRVGKVQLEGFAFTWVRGDVNQVRRNKHLRPRRNRSKWRNEMSDSTNMERKQREQGEQLMHPNGTRHAFHATGK